MLNKETFEVKEADRDTWWEITVKKHFEERKLKTDDAKSFVLKPDLSSNSRSCFFLSVLKSNCIKNKPFFFRCKGANIIKKT